MYLVIFLLIFNITYYLFTKEDLKLVVDTPLILECEKEFTRLWPKEIPKALSDPSKDRYDIEWWNYYGCCERLALLLIYPMIKLLYPNLTLKLLSGKNHATIITDKFVFEQPKVTSYSRNLNDPLIFDIISMSINEPLDWIYEKLDDYIQLIDEEDFSMWWTTEIFNGVYDASCDLIADIGEL